MSNEIYSILLGLAGWVIGLVIAVWIVNKLGK